MKDLLNLTVWNELTDILFRPFSICLQCPDHAYLEAGSARLQVQVVNAQN